MGVLFLMLPDTDNDPPPSYDVPEVTVDEVEAALGFSLDAVPQTVDAAIASGRVKLLIVSDANCDDAS